MIETHRVATGSIEVPYQVCFDLLSGSVLEFAPCETCDICIEVPTWEMLRYGDHSYTRISSPIGGVVEAAEDWGKEAPESGYQPAIMIEMKSNDRAANTGAALVYFWSRNEAIWGALKVQASVMHDRGPGVSARIDANPRGSRSLNRRLGHTIEVPVTLPYTDSN